MTDPYAPREPGMSPSLVIRLLQLLDQGATMPQLRAVSGMARVQTARYLRYLREGFGCEIDYDRGANRYRLTGWGVFDAEQVRRWL